MSFFENTRKPVGLGGKLMVAMMNLGHSPMTRWGLRFLRLAPNAKVLDCGCGGGANIKTLLKLCPKGKVQGIDYSAVSVEKARKVNAGAIVGVQPAGITITAARTRFGSCSGKNRLSFSLYLMAYPPDAIEYVVVHELAHIRHHDHSPAFYREVETYLPDWKRRRDLLRP